MGTLSGYNPLTHEGAHGYTFRGLRILLVIKRVAMKRIDLTKKPAMLETIDTFLAAVPWTKNRTVIIYLREHGGRRYVRIRTFNKHKTKGCWYPTKRYYMVPIQSAAALGKAIVAASKGKPFDPQPDWWAEFDKQYEALKGNRSDKCNRQ